MAAVMQPSDLSIGRSVDLESADMVFDALEDTQIITEDGSDWLKSSLDPFHDEQLVLEGQPSYSQADTVVQCIPKTFVVSADGLNLQPGETWDVNIFNLPIDTTCLAGTFAPTISSGNHYRITTDATLTGRIGMVTAAKVKSGAKTFPDGTPFTGPVIYEATSPTDVTGTVTVPTRQNNYVTGAHRIVGLGFEVVNPTAFLNIQGLVTAYRQNQQSYQLYGNEIDNLGASQGPYTEINLIRGPPASADAAYLLRHSRQWEARSGSYTVCTQAGWDNPFQYPRQMLPILKGDDSQGVVDDLTIPNSLALIQKGGLGDAQTQGYLNYSVHPFNTSGVYYTGLSQETVLQVNVRFYVERAPTLSESDLIVLANPSPPYDPNAWKLYSEARSSMPVGVKLSENSLGTWFKKAAGTLVKDILPIGKAVAKTVLPALGPAGRVAADAIEAAETAYADPPRQRTRTERLPEPPEHQARGGSRRRLRRKRDRQQGANPRPRRRKPRKANN